MFGKRYAASMINRSAENQQDRRRFLRAAGVTGLGVIGAGALGGLAGPAASAGTVRQAAGEAAAAEGVSDGAVLNFALNLEYLEAEFYLHAVTGKGLADSLTTGTGTRGGVTGGRAVRFKTKAAKQYAQEIAGDERAHVEFLRTALGSAAVSRPAIDLQASFTAAAQAAGLVRKGQSFDAFACEENFLLAAYLFEDVGVTAYKGAAPLITNKAYLEAAAGILAVEAYHAANIRTALYQHSGGILGLGLLGRDLREASVKLSNARDSLDGTTDLDQGVVDRNGQANIVPTDGNGIAYSRTPGQVLNIVYLNPKAVTSGGFFPKGVNGDVNTSDPNG
ncbi:ferritin-like domain-containing protein [Amycolatopsis roodepoortensis]|uniref:ferritin-like domain-containing protein n=1 Tax=Amycolatopsis roodepoortensis TaxID=700274 RepID=UPI00214C7617|nr:ferritin-like domain-containing protein [Amycolatopsis roodepoortensis]UUV32983.1 ferritin-like domain-containing protein [Amycolatopsis roodepoortensis]